MELSTQVYIDNISWKTLNEIAAVVDAGTWDTLWNYDHLVPPHAELLPHVAPEGVDKFEEGDTFEGWSVLAAWAASTKRVRIGNLVTAIPFRNPALLAKMAATVDHISGGRLELGLGAAWHTGEARAYGIALGENKEKFARFTEALEVLRLLLEPGPGRRNFQGEYFQLDHAPFAPAPVQSRLPVLIGGGGEKKTIPLVARYADTYNFFGNLLANPEVLSHKNRVLDEAALAIGRDPHTIKRSVGIFADVEPSEARARQRRQALAGPLGQAAEDSLLYGSAQQVLDGVERIVNESKFKIGEIIFCGLAPDAEAYQRFDEQVLRPLRSGLPQPVVSR